MGYISKDKENNSDRELFEKYYAEFYDCTYQSAYRVLKDPWVAEDVTAQTFAKLYERFSLYKDIEAAKFKALCRVCARNEALDYLRHKKASGRVIYLYSQQNDMVSVLGIPEKEVITQEEAQRVNKAFYSLPISYQKILFLKYNKELSVKEISHRLGITPKNAEVRLRRARKQLRMFLGKGLIIVAAILLFVHSDAYAQINNFFIEQIANRYFLVTEAKPADDIRKNTEPLTCDYIPDGYILTQEAQRDNVSFLQYTHQENHRIFFVDRVRAGIDYQLDCEDNSIKMMNYKGNLAIFLMQKMKMTAINFCGMKKKKDMYIPLPIKPI